MDGAKFRVRVGRRVQKRNRIAYSVRSFARTARVVCAIEEPAVIERILRHLGLWHVPARKRAPPPAPSEITLDYSVADEPASYDEPAVVPPSPTGKAHMRQDKR